MTYISFGYLVLVNCLNYSIFTYQSGSSHSRHNSFAEKTEHTAIKNSYIFIYYHRCPKHRFICLFACTGSYLRHVGSSLPRAGSSLRHEGSSVVACKLLVVACGIQFPDQGSNPGPLHWERGVLATGPPGKSRFFVCFFFFKKHYQFSC